MTGHVPLYVVVVWVWTGVETGTVPPLSFARSAWSCWICASSAAIFWAIVAVACGEGVGAVEVAVDVAVDDAIGVMGIRGCLRRRPSRRLHPVPRRH